eukprot:2545225-Ditylum_brightwellii.AAC.1
MLEDDFSEETHAFDQFQMGLAVNSEVPGLGFSRSDVAQAFLNANMASTSSRSNWDQVGGSPPPLPGATDIATELQTTPRHS